MNPRIMTAALVCLATVGCAGTATEPTTTAPETSASQQAYNKEKADATIAALDACQVLTAADGEAVLGGPATPLDAWQGARCVYTVPTNDAQFSFGVAAGTSTGEDTVKAATDEYSGRMEEGHAIPEVGEGAWVGWTKADADNITAVISWTDPDGVNYKLAVNDSRYDGHKGDYFDPKATAEKMIPIAKRIHEDHH